MSQIKYYIFLYILVSPFWGYSQEATNEKLEIVSYDSLRQVSTSKGILLEMIGSVHLKQGKAELFCNRAEYWKKTQETIIEQNVRIYDGKKTLIADKVFYYGVPQIFKALGNVLLKDSIRVITSNQIKYFKVENRIEADRNVVMKDSVNFVKIFGQHAKIDNNKDYALITGNPILVRSDSTGQEEFRIKSLKMELFENGTRALITDSVKITQKEITATCGFAEFYKDKNEIFLKKNPVVEQEGQYLSGEVIQLFIKNNNLIKAIINNNAFITSRVDTVESDQRLNKMTGRDMTMFFKDNNIYKVIVEGQATSFYHISEDNEEKGLNEIIGDKITVFIEDSKINRILIESKPQFSSGKFYPHVVTKKEGDQ